MADSIWRSKTRKVSELDENRYTGVFEVGDYESTIRFSKFKMDQAPRTVRGKGTHYNQAPRAVKGKGLTIIKHPERDRTLYHVHVVVSRLR